MEGVGEGDTDITQPKLAAGQPVPATQGHQESHISIFNLKF